MAIVIDIDKRGMNNALCLLRSALVGDVVDYDRDKLANDIQYDHNTTFGFIKKGSEKEVESRKRDVIADGKFVLSNDKKHVQYMYFVNGAYRYLMKDLVNPLSFKISELNSFQKSNLEKSDLHEKLEKISKERLEAIENTYSILP